MQYIKRSANVLTPSFILNRVYWIALDCTGEPDVVAVECNLKHFSILQFTVFLHAHHSWQLQQVCSAKSTNCPAHND